MCTDLKFYLLVKGNITCFCQCAPNDTSKLKGFANDTFECDEIDRKFSKRVENTVGKGEIAHYKQKRKNKGLLGNRY